MLQGTRRRVLVQAFSVPARLRAERLGVSADKRRHAPGRLRASQKKMSLFAESTLA
jgi:hypothetical protein